MSISPSTWVLCFVAAACRQKSLGLLGENLDRDADHPVLGTSMSEPPRRRGSENGRGLSYALSWCVIRKGKRMRIALLAALIALFAGCPATKTTEPVKPSPAPVAQPVNESAPPSSSPATAVAEPGTLSTEAFGGERFGFVEGSSESGRIVVLRRFDGDSQPSFAHHGETSTPNQLTVFDRFTGKERGVDELIDLTVDRDHLLVLADQQLWLIDGVTGAWAAFGDVGMDGDGNACLAPRQANFSAKGKRVAWASTDAKSLHVRDLGSGEEWSVAANGRLWRGWPEDEGRAAVMLEVAAGTTGWPTQRTSCACRWCNRFAASSGVYGWDGPAFTLERVAEDGSRSPGTPPEGERSYTGPTESGCKLEARETETAGLEKGPWRWVCP